MITKEDLYYIKMAEGIATQTTCGILSVGCVIVNNGEVVATGANTTIKGYKSCEEVGHVLTDEGNCMRQIHAEANAILNCEKEKLVGATAYVTHEPCEYCTKLLNHREIKRVIFKTQLPNPYNKYFIEPMEWINMEKLKGD